MLDKAFVRIGDGLVSRRLFECSGDVVSSRAGDMQEKILHLRVDAVRLGLVKRRGRGVSVDGVK